ncbi:SNO glutamine amidotransferase, partial [Rhizophagus irregularis]
MIKIGVLALQGAVSEHIHQIEFLGCEAIPVKTIEDLNGLDGLILPGGESTTM